ncbi:MAG: helix-turn-helix domain-containing protein [Giesbergeria sp.]|jgi:IS30 family transposase
MHYFSSHYEQLQPEDRVTIASLQWQNCSVRAIVRQLHRYPAAINLELQGNACSSGYGSTTGYQCEAGSTILLDRRPLTQSPY